MAAKTSTPSAKASTASSTKVSSPPPAAAAPRPLSERIEDSLTVAGARDRASIEKHLAACDREETRGHAVLWRRLATKLGSLVSLPIQTAGANALLFFTPDGKYRMQVFALEDRGDGVLTIYMPDVLTDAVKAKILAKTGGTFAVAGSKDDKLALESLDAANTIDPPQHVKNLIGWNRKALRISLPTATPDSTQVQATEALCSLAAKQWTKMA